MMHNDAADFGYRGLWGTSVRHRRGVYGMYKANGLQTIERTLLLYAR